MIIILLGIRLEPAKDASVESQKFLAAALGAVSGYLTTVFIEGAESADEGWVGERAKAAFKKTFVGVLPPGSDGWGRFRGRFLEANRAGARPLDKFVRRRYRTNPATPRGVIPDREMRRRVEHLP
jgi:hypothetical protein